MADISLKMVPQPGNHIIFREGDFLTVGLHVGPGRKGRAWLRTSLFRPGLKSREIIEKTEKGVPRRFQEWGDLPMHRVEEGVYRVTVPLVTVGFFEAKAFFLSEDVSEPEWPAGDNLYVKVEPADSVISNSIYSAFVRLFMGEDKISNIRSELASIGPVGEKGYATIPESGKFRDLAGKVKFIIDQLGFDIIMLLPVHPAPTTYARMGLFGSPYAALDFMNVDPAKAVFDKLTTPMEQFGELIDAVHARHARIFMDIPVNHTGWASQLQVHHPEYFVKSDTGKFVSPGAWGVTWSDLAKLDYSQKGLWEYMAGVFLFWCNKGVDGFRCDAGYMIPADAWKYITARVRSQYPSTIFLLEGLGGKVSTTEKLLTDCNLNWAYSELFQNYDQGQIDWYMEQYNRITFKKGPLVNFSETHDNNRLASVSKEFSALRNALTALLSDTGTYGITCGVEWYADEKIDVHRLTSLKWGVADNQVRYIRRLNNILKTHPSFQAGSSIEKIHVSNLNTIAYKRYSPDRLHSLTVIANLSEKPGDLFVDRHKGSDLLMNSQDLLTGEDVSVTDENDQLRLWLKPYQVAAVSNDPDYHYQAVDHRVDGFVKAAKAERQLKLQIIKLFLSSREQMDEKWLEEMTRAFEAAPYRFFFDHFEGRPPVIQWHHPRDIKREVVIPEKTPLLVMAGHYFRFRLKNKGQIVEHGEGFYLDDHQYVSILAPDVFSRGGQIFHLEIEVYDREAVTRQTGHLLVGSQQMFDAGHTCSREAITSDDLLSALTVNERSGVCFARGKFSELKSKYDALISANLNLHYPDDRHIMLARIRGWTVYKGFSRALDFEYQQTFSQEGNTIRYAFQMPAGGGMHIPLRVNMIFDTWENHLSVELKRLASDETYTPPADEPVKIIIRPDIESRNHHELTKAFAGLEQRWPRSIREHSSGFLFHDGGGELRMNLSEGRFIREDEWQYMVNRPIEEERGMDGNSDLYSPGYFEFTLKEGGEVVIDARVESPQPGHSESSADKTLEKTDSHAGQPATPGEALKASMGRFIVRRNSNRTVIAGYPWFLDWGRDTLICLRGMISAGYSEASELILTEFANFEKEGTLPNVIRGKDVSNRDTSDAPLWFFAGVKAFVDKQGAAILEKDCGGRSLLEVLKSIARHYMVGTSNGIRMDEASGLIYSPTHFTWMDTNYPAGTPRQGYPIEIQALWHHALSFMAVTEPSDHTWKDLAQKVQQSISRYYPVKNEDARAFGGNYLADCLHADAFIPASKASRDDHIRPNQLFAVTLGAVEDDHLKASVLAACEELIIPGAIRSLADRPVQYHLPVMDHDRLLNDPQHPYFGKYSGDEDHSRKPAYHNGTAWTWPFPSYCEALWMTYGTKARRQAADMLASSMKILNQGCISQLPEVLDGDYPHRQKGCYAQAWGMTELYRVARLLKIPGF